MSETPALYLQNLSRRYGEGEGAVEVLADAELALWPGEAVALVAPSGAGKSTLLHLAGLLETPSAGEVYVAGQPTSQMTRQGAHGAAAFGDRLRLSVPSPAAGVLGARKTSRCRR